MFHLGEGESTDLLRTNWEMSLTYSPKDNLWSISEIVDGDRKVTHLVGIINWKVREIIAEARNYIFRWNYCCRRCLSSLLLWENSHQRQFISRADYAVLIEVISCRVYMKGHLMSVKYMVSINRNHWACATRSSPTRDLFRTETNGCSTFTSPCREFS